MFPIKAERKCEKQRERLKVMSNSQKVPGAIEPDLQTFAGQPWGVGSAESPAAGPVLGPGNSALEGEQQSSANILGCCPCCGLLPTMKGGGLERVAIPGASGE